MNPVLKLVSRDDADKQRALEAALSQIDRAFGKGSVMKLGDKGKVVEIESVSTGSLGLDMALGIGGLPKGRIIEIYGPESSGKTTLALHVVAEVQKAGGTAGFIDAEHALDPSYAHKLGVNLDDLLVSQPDTGEQALEITDTLVRSGAVDVIVIDSVAALTPRAEIEGEMGDSLPGLQARLMSQALRKLTASISKSKTLVIFINQIRMKIGVMYGSPETTTGGNALKFYASVRLDIRRTGSVKIRDEIVDGRAVVKATGRPVDELVGLLEAGEPAANVAGGRPLDLVAVLEFAALGDASSEGCSLVQRPPGRPRLEKALTPSGLSGLFPGASKVGLLALSAGLLQVFDFWDASHEAAQEADDLGERRFSAYWHGIAHRREPDPGNASYWFRRVGAHRPIIARRP